MREAFRVIDPSITDEGFLTVFQSAGCYLIDTCTEPVDHLDAQSRRAACFASDRHSPGESAGSNRLPL
jgi:hypothetical protein